MQSIKKYLNIAINSITGALKKALGFCALYLSKFDSFLCTSKQSFIFLIIFSFFTNILLEASLRKSFLEPFKLIFTSPLVFLIGFLIVFASFTLIYLFKRRFFAYTLITMLWFIIASVSYYLMCQRSTPFNSSDFRVLKTTFDIITIYFTTFEIILLALGILLIIALLVLAFLKCKKASGISSYMFLVPFFTCAITITAVILNTVYVLAADRFDNLPNKYREHGFTYCFLYSVIDNGIDKPNNYTKNDFHDHRKRANATVITKKPEIQSEKKKEPVLLDKIYDMVIEGYESMPQYLTLDFTQEQADEITEKITEKYKKMQSVSTSTSNASSVDNPDAILDTDAFGEEFDRPNIIFLQLESFYDVTNIEGYEYSNAPHPIYSLLKEELPGGLLTVPSIGAGTANTEFEVLTGMDVSFFGIAEYPYLSVLQSSTCESMAYNAKEYGYLTHAIHNHKGTFYDRNNVYPRLGFDTFTSIENTPNIIRNKRNWGKDAMLIDPILTSLDYSEGKDLIFTVSVQPHGRYPSEAVYEKLLQGQEPKIAVTGNDDNPENPGFTYYVNQLNEVDNFIGNLILELSFRNEPTVLVMYGDHLPAFSVQKYWSLKEGDCYQTDYMIWNNCGLDFSDAKNLSTFQLCAYIFSKVGIGVGDFNMLNQLYLNGDVKDYAHLRHIYQYATLYDNALKKPGSPVDIPTYEKADTVYGLIRTEISGIYTIGETSYIKGKNFNDFSRVCINGEVYDTKYLDGSTLCTDASFENGDVVSIVQFAVNRAILGESANNILYSNLMIVPEEKHQQYLELFVPVTEDEEEIISDATSEFETGADEMGMIQEDITKSNYDTNENTSSNTSEISISNPDGNIIPDEEIRILG